MKYNNGIINYLNSLKDKKNIYSGEDVFLEGALKEKFIKMESLELELYSIKNAGMMHKDDFEKLIKEYKTRLIDYKKALIDELPDEYVTENHENILKERFKNMLLEFDVKENGKKPLYTDVIVQWKNNGEKTGCTFKIDSKCEDGEIFDDKNIFYINSINDLERLISKNNSEDFFITDVKSFYRNKYSPEENKIHSSSSEVFVIDDIRIYNDSLNRMYIRCKFDDICMPSKRLDDIDIKMLKNGSVTKEEIALKYFEKDFLNLKNEESFKTNIRL